MDKAMGIREVSDFNAVTASIKHERDKAGGKANVKEIRLLYVV
jgi:hypothetical protein